MKKIRQTFKVEFNYDVHFTEKLFDVKNSLLWETIASAGKAKVGFIIDAGVVKAFPQIEADIRRYCAVHHEHFELVHSPIIMEGGEACKNDPQSLTRIQAAINHSHLCRHSWLIAIGGGAILDLA